MSTQQSPFLLLPSELRREIYTHTFTRPAEGATSDNCASNSGIVLACVQTHKESLELYYGSTFGVEDMEEGIDFFIMTPTRHLNNLKNVHLTGPCRRCRRHAEIMSQPGVEVMADDLVEQRKCVKTHVEALEYDLNHSGGMNVQHGLIKTKVFGWDRERQKYVPVWSADPVDVPLLLNWGQYKGYANSS